MSERGEAVGPAARGARRRPGRRGVVGLLLLLGAALLGSALPTWVSSTGSTVIDPRVPVRVAGTVAAPGVSAAALVVLAGALALAIVGRAGRWVVLLVVAAAGAVAAAAAVGVWSDPDPVARTAAGETTVVTDLVAPVTVSVWPVVSIVLGALVVVVAVLGAVGSGGWRTSTRHERVAVPADPTEASSGAGTSSGAGPDRQPGLRGDEPVDGPGEPGADHELADDHELWDSLTRGEDPTRHD